MATPITPLQEMLLLALSADTGITTPTSNSCTDASNLLDFLQQTSLPFVNAAASHDWSVVWGPAVLSKLDVKLQRHVVNVLYVARDSSTNDYTIAIAGTDFDSLYDWLVLDADVYLRVDWPYGNPPDKTFLAHGTHQGLTNLQALMPCTGLPGAGTTLYGWLSDLQYGTTPASTINVTGHSLGGALSFVTALWLRDTQGAITQNNPAPWDPKNLATINCFSYAGPTPGNDVFSTYFSGRVKNTTRVWNAIDVVPNAWNYDTMSGTLATWKAGPTPPSSDIATAWSGLAESVRLYGYTPILPATTPLPGTFNASETTFAAQVLYQHVQAYLDLTGTAQWTLPPK